MKRTCGIVIAIILMVSCMFAYAEEQEHTHSWGSWTTKTAATCTAEGKQLRTCSDCGAMDEQSIAATGHSWGSWTTKTAATCTADGKEIRMCSECGDTEEQTIAATGHNWGSWTTKTAATCTADGKEIRMCSGCGDTEEQTIAATGHTIVIVQPAVDATCTQIGLTVEEYCSVCDYEAEQQEIPALGHQYKTVTYKPTTKSSGYQKHTCTVCGHEYRDNFKSKLAGKKAAPAATPTPAPVVEILGEFGTIVFDEFGISKQYVTEWDIAEEEGGAATENILTISAAADESGAYDLSELHLSFEMINQLKEQKVAAIRFVVGEAELWIPMSIFDDEALAVVKEDLDEPVGYVFTVDPNATLDADKAGCFVKMEMATAEDAFDVTGVSDGLVLRFEEAEIIVAESAVYPSI